MFDNSMGLVSLVMSAEVVNKILSSQASNWSDIQAEVNSVIKQSSVARLIFGNAPKLTLEESLNSMVMEQLEQMPQKVTLDIIQQMVTTVAEK